jgi:PAS domain S-box-containing protein
MMVVLDPKGYVMMLNRAGQTLLGYAEAELLGRNWFATCLPQPEGLDNVYPVFQRIMAGELDAFAEQENTVLCRDGRQRLIGWHNSCFRDDAGRIVGILSSGEDITVRRRAEEALLQKVEELRASNAELEQLNRLMVGRELHMIELKEEINELCRRLGEPPRHATDQLQTDSVPGAGPAPAPPGGGGA